MGTTVRILFLWVTKYALKVRYPLKHYKVGSKKKLVDSKIFVEIFQAIESLCTQKPF